MRIAWLCLTALCLASVAMVSSAPLYDNEVEELLDGHDWPDVERELQRMHITEEMKALYMIHMK